MKSLAVTILAGAAALAIATPPGAAMAAKAPSSISGLQALSDRAAIEDLVGRYEWALDAGDAQAYGALFAEDGVLSSGFAPDQNGRAAIVKLIEDLNKRFAAPSTPGGKRPMRIQHILSNLVIDLHGDRADARSYWTEVWNPKGPGLEVRAAGHYEDQLVKRGGKWMFSHRRIADDIMPAVTPGP